MRRTSRPASTPGTTEPFSATKAVGPRPPQSGVTATPPTPAWAGRRDQRRGRARAGRPAAVGAAREAEVGRGARHVADEVQLVGRPAQAEVVAPSSLTSSDAVPGRRPGRRGRAARGLDRRSLPSPRRRHGPRVARPPHRPLAPCAQQRQRPARRRARPAALVVAVGEAEVRRGARHVAHEVELVGRPAARRGRRVRCRSPAATRCRARRPARKARAGRAPRCAGRCRRP